MPEVRSPVMPASNTKRRDQIPEVQFPVMPANNIKERGPNARSAVPCDAC